MSADRASAPPGQVDGLLGRQVPALQVVLRGLLERGLDQQQVRAAHGVDDGVAGAGVAGVGEAAAVGRVDHDAPGRDVVPAPDEPDGQRADRQRRSRVVLDRLEGRVEEAVALRDGRRQGVEPRAAARREVDRQRSRRRIGPREQVPEPDDIEVVVRVHVPDDERVEPRRVHEPLEAAHRALAGIEHQRRVAPVHEEPCRRPVGVRRRRAAAEHGQAEASRRRRRHVCRS